MSTLDTDVLVVGSGPAGLGGRPAARTPRPSGHARREAAGPAPQGVRRRAHATRRSPSCALLDVDPLDAAADAGVEGVRMIAAGRELDRAVAEPPRPAGPRRGRCAATCSTNCSATASATPARRADGPRGHRAGRRTRFRPRRRDARTADGERRDPRRASSSSPTARTVGSGGRSAPPASRDWPYGIATRSYWHSPRTTDTWLETRLGIPDANGNPIAGYGWIAPVGDGTVNIGIGVLSSYRDVRGVNALKLLDAFARQVADRMADRSRRPAQVADAVPGAARRFGRPDDGPDVPRRRRCRRRRQPVQRRRRRTPR